MKNILVIATRSGEGKTAISLGLIALLEKRIHKVGYIKPVGKGTVDFAGEKIDQDVALIKEVCKVPSYVRDMGPIILDGFPEDWITRDGRQAVLAKIKKGFANAASGRNLMLVEGTGNAATGAAFGLSAGFMAKMLNAKVLLVASGGVGQSTDEIILNKNYLERAGVDLLGVILNKVYPHEMDRIRRWMRPVLEAMSVPFLGALPYENDLARATMMNLYEAFRGVVVNGEASMGQPLGRVVLGAMSAQTALDQLTGQVTLICPADREDVIVAALSAMYISGRKDFTLSSIVITGKGKLSETVLRMIRRTTIPVVHVEPDAYTVVSQVHTQSFKISPADMGKIGRATEMVRQHINIEDLVRGLA